MRKRCSKKITTWQTSKHQYQWKIKTPDSSTHNFNSFMEVSFLNASIIKSRLKRKNLRLKKFKTKDLFWVFSLKINLLFLLTSNNDKNQCWENKIYKVLNKIIFKSFLFSKERIQTRGIRCFYLKVFCTPFSPFFERQYFSGILSRWT